MGRTSASHKASGGEERRSAPRPSSEAAVYRRPSGANADGAPTVRNLIPWRDMEKKLAEKLAAKAAAGELSGELELENGDLVVAEPEPAEPTAPPKLSSKPPPWKTDIEPAPDSGVRSSEAAVRELTYSVYTVADLEARGQVRPPRMSMAFAPPMAPQPSRWSDVARSALALARAWWSCVRAPKPRPRVSDVCLIPAQQLLTDAKVALAGLPWRKIAIGGGLAFGTLVVLLFVVLTAAELTDDLKPARATSAMTATTANNGDVASPAVAPTAFVEAKPNEPSAGADPEPAATIELEDETPPPAAKPKPKSKKPTPKKKPVELFNP